MKNNIVRKHWRWGLLAFFAILVGIAAIAPYATLNPANFNTATARYANESNVKYVGLFVHVFASGVALLLGPFQFLNDLRVRRPLLHRWVGRVYMLGIVLGGLSAFVIAPGIISGLVGEIGLITLAGLWLWTGYKAYSTIRAGNVDSHRQWMIRNYALTFAAATLRLWLGVLIASQLPMLQSKYGGNFDALFTEVYRVVMWLAWVPNLIIAEWLLIRRPSSKEHKLHASTIISLNDNTIMDSQHRRGAASDRI
ncbi:MAG: DUF2306 domain-containing protein [Chloroflexota bacterium]|jgi:uncharacterized membrane protein|nr:DUF2306 domain-containing protein [Chloroflexota bacterium]